MLGSQDLVKGYPPFPRPYLHAGQPNYFFLGLNHSPWALTCIPSAKLFPLAVNFHYLIFFVLKRIVNGKIDCVLMPAVIENHLWNITALWLLFTIQILNLMQGKQISDSIIALLPFLYVAVIHFDVFVEKHCFFWSQIQANLPNMPLSPFHLAYFEVLPLAELRNAPYDAHWLPRSCLHFDSKS